MDNNNLMTQEDIDKVVNIYKNCSGMEDGETKWYPLAEDAEDNLWAIVFGKGYDPDYQEDVMVKIAFCPNRSTLWEYSFDWLMPYDESSGDVWDTETFVGIGSDDEYCAKHVRWFAKQWEQMVNSGIVNFEDEEEYEDEDEEDE